ncbi:MAG: hypothetical protein HXN23_07590 [Porphyromonas sp.]|uniref:hypothetical protein n=1 Tax=Porphyromonas sp. TaxID=1924944 RepID=UPI001CADC455|nr:hypothetical protein [Porphyromonas sp.]MBF1406092.1 hypothetical protein [Porphyromonas sp.]
MTLDKLKNIIQSSHINFLFGAGLSRPYLTTLGNIETWLTECATIENESVRKITEDNLKINYVEGVMKPCLDAISMDKKPKELEGVENAYRDFLRIWNHIISRRGSSLLSKQVNIFTTNIDPLVEGVAEDLGVEFNNGFKGMMRPVFREEAFSTTVSKVSPLFQRTSELPTFNYLKMHGSVNWRREENRAEIFYDGHLETLAKVVEHMEKYPFRYPVIEVLQDKLDEENEGKDDSPKRKQLIENLSKAVDDAIRRKQSAPKVEGAVEEEIPAQSLNIDSASSELMQSFRKAYDDLVMINPRKAKFRETVLDLHFYELMRLYANALEKPTTCLFAMGFSFADEHIAQITRRAVASNPTLLVIIFAYDDGAKEAIQECIGESNNNNNIIILSPKEFKAAQDEEGKNAVEELKVFDLASINKYVFGQIGIVSIEYGEDHNGSR